MAAHAERSTGEPSVCATGGSPLAVTRSRKSDLVAGAIFPAILPPDHPDNDYGFCYPDDLLREIAKQTITVCQRLKLKPFHEQLLEEENLPALLLRAWEVYHSDHSAYIDWEADVVLKLKAQFSATH
jgi:hypothetical protein